MPVHSRLTALSSAIAVTFIVAIAWAVGAAPIGGMIAGSAVRSAQAAAVSSASPTEGLYVSIAPCRVLDTRAGGGKITNGTTRAVYVAGTTGFPAQGGKSGGCGVPIGATAVTASVLAVNSTNSGSLTAFPAGGTLPSATTLYVNSGITGNTGATLPLTPGAAKQLAIRTTATTDVVIDVTGYYTQQISAKVTDAGALETASNRVVSATRLSTGLYQITIDRQTAGCVPTASAWGGTDYFTSTSVTSNVVFVYIWDQAGLAKNSYFTFSLTC